MQITLKVKQEESNKKVDKKYIAAFIPAILFKKTIQLANQFENVSENEISEEMSDIMVNYIVEVYDNQFTMEEFYAGADVGDILPKFRECIETIMTKFGNKTKELADLNK